MEEKEHGSFVPDKWFLLTLLVDIELIMNWRSILELMTDGADVCQCERRWCQCRLLWCWCYRPENHFTSLDEWAPRGDSLPTRPPTITSMSCFMMTGAWPLISCSATASWEVRISWRIVSPFTIKSTYKSKSEKERSNGARSWLCSATAQRHLGTLWNIVFGDMTALQGPADSFLIFRLEIVNAIQIWRAGMQLLYLCNYLRRDTAQRFQKLQRKRSTDLSCGWETCLTSSLRPKID